MTTGHSIANMGGYATDETLEDDTMHRLTFYNLGNADSYLVELDRGGMLLFDYAATRVPGDRGDLRVDLPGALRDKLEEKGRDGFDVVAFSHLDRDHYQGSAEFFELLHARKYQGHGRAKIGELWVPAAAITGEDLPDEAAVIRAEARYRLRQGKGIRVFSRPEKLRNWLESVGLSLEERKHLITDAGQVVPGWTKVAQGVEFFAHSPFAVRTGLDLEDRNTNALVLQATFLYAGQETRFVLAGDATHEVLAAIVDTTRQHGREERLEWGVLKLPHHCSYLSLNEERGAIMTEPVPDVAWLLEEQGRTGGVLVSSSWPIPASYTDPQPPHRQASAYYRQIAEGLDGEFVVTMEHPSASRPEPLVVEIGGGGAMVRKPTTGAAAIITGQSAPRAGR